MAANPQETLAYTPLSASVRDGVSASLVRLGFPANALLEDYRFPSTRGGSLRINLVAFADAVRRIPTYASITLFNAANGRSEAEIVRALANSTAPFHLIARDHTLSFWVCDHTEDGRQSLVPRPIRRDFSLEHTDRVLTEFAEDLSPERIIRVKEGRERFHHALFRDLRPLQLSLFVENVTRDLLREYFTHAVDILRREQRRVSKGDEEKVFKLAIQLLGAKILGDTGVLGDDARRTGNLFTLIDMAYKRFRRYFDRTLFLENAKSAEAAYGHLSAISCAGFVPDMLTDLYVAALSPSEQKRWGRYDTPLFLTRRIWDNIPVEFLPPGQRTVADMTCGWGSFLIAGYERLARIPDMEATPVRPLIHGNDRDFTSLLAGLGLLLSTSDDSWDINDGDALTWDWLRTHSPGIIVGNPPFEGDRKRQVRRSETRQQWADEFLWHAIDRLAPGGYLAMLMPQSFVAAESSPHLREHLRSTCDIQEIWELPTSVFRDPTVHTMVLFARKKPRPHPLAALPVRVRTVDRHFLEDFRSEGVFTASGIVRDQRAWNVRSVRGRSNRSTNSFVFDYSLILSAKEWEQLRSSSRRLDEFAQVFPGVGLGKNPKRKRWKDYLNPRTVRLLSKPRISMPSPFVIHYEHAITKQYPNDFEEPRKNEKHPEDDKEEFLAGTKVILSSNNHPSWGNRVKVAIERRGYFVPDNYYVLVPRPTAPTHISHEVIAAVSSWKVANAWVVEHLKHPKIPAPVVREIPFPSHLDEEDCERLVFAVQELEKGCLEEDKRRANNQIDNVLKKAYGLDEDTFKRLSVIAGWIEAPRILDPVVHIESADWHVSGVIEDVSPTAETLRLRLQGWPEARDVPVATAMPGWLLRPNTAFRARVPRRMIRSRSAEEMVWGPFQPELYTYLDEAELLEALGSVVSSARKNDGGEP